jgi:ribulose-5-phosphate 4-epimerase/fuculose-1-phosphate aldolase
MDDFFVSNRVELEAFSDMSRAIGSRADYVQGGGGNTSVKLAGGAMAIKASGFHLLDVKPDGGYAVVDGAALSRFYRDHEPGQFPDVEKAGADEAKKAAVPVEGLAPLRPSVEAGFHSLLSRFVAHSHSVYANLASCCLEAERVTAEALDGAPYASALVPYVNPGAMLTFTLRDRVAKTLEECGRVPGVLLLRNHGLIAHDDDMRACLALHEDANLRFQRRFGVSAEGFPKPKVTEQADGSFLSNTPWLWERLKGSAHPNSALMDEPMYPDQMVFFQGTLGKDAMIDRANGKTIYRTPEKTARTIEETLCAVVFIRETLLKLGLTPISMGEAARQFISGWESEAYRKQLAEGKS